MRGSAPSYVPEFVISTTDRRSISSELNMPNCMPTIGSMSESGRTIPGGILSSYLRGCF
jgi:hypothetical protein